MAKVLDQDQKLSIKKHGIKIMSESLEKRNPKKLDYRSIFIRCNCHTELLILDYDGECDMVELSIYELVKVSKTSLWQKFRHIYRVLRYGQPYTDQIILGRDQINELKAFINNL
jgi:hypothetical protein